MWFTALILGLAGSLHCLFMCSPLAMAVTGLRGSFMLNRITYNLGRILSYGVLGMLVSSFGYLFQFSGYQNMLSIILGGILIVMGISGMSSVYIPQVNRLMSKGTNLLKKVFAKFLNKKTWSSMTIMGMLNGLLPCGLTYLALTYCITLPRIEEGFVFMIIFGMGTMPVMLGLTTVLQKMITRFHINFSRLTTTVMIVLGVVLISRGWYVQDHQHVVNVVTIPKTAAATQEIIICK